MYEVNNNQSTNVTTPLPHREGQGGGSLGSLFSTFFKIGMVTFGGGYAMIPIIETEVTEKHQWMKKEELLDLIAIAQSCPGVFAINISTFIGYKLHKTNYIAADLASGEPHYDDMYTTSQMEDFIDYLSHADSPGPSIAARETVLDILLQIYSKPVFNKIRQ